MEDSYLDASWEDRFELDTHYGYLPTETRRTACVECGEYPCECAWIDMEVDRLIEERWYEEGD